MPIVRSADLSTYTDGRYLTYRVMREADSRSIDLLEYVVIMAVMELPPAKHEWACRRPIAVWQG